MNAFGLPDDQVVVLASGSPRRLTFLRQLGIEPIVRPADIDESPLPGEDPHTYVKRLAVEKASVLDVAADALVIAADTTIDLDGEILAKPEDAADAKAMLLRQAGRSHRVLTGVAVRRGAVVEVEVVSTIVTMVAADDALLDWYVSTGEPLDKAGAYAVQGSGAVLVESLEGSVSNVVGLPLTALVALVRRVLAV